MFTANLVMFFSLALIIYLAAAGRRRLSVIDYVRYVVPFRDWKSRTAFVDVCFYVAFKLAAGLQRALGILVSVQVAAVGHGILVASFGPTHAAPLSFGILAACYLVTFLVGDFTLYATHNLVHRVPILWELHKVHHSATFLSPFTKYRQHPLDDQINIIPNLVAVGMVIAAIRYIYAFSDAQAALMLICVESFGAIIGLDPFRHSHIPVSFGPLEKVLQSPNMHRLHHSSDPKHFNKNFGQRLSVWDWIFGTAAAAPVGEPLAFGIGDGKDCDYDTILKCYVMPLVKITAQPGNKLALD
jgi:sterol desaturase/sphingolipid hydroxylase (fatty acid hydroxylase superfamily)